MTIKFAHLTDLHLPTLAPPAWRELLNKRLLGYLSWSRKRKHRHRLEALNAVAADIRTAAPHGVLISGDIVNIALPAEFDDARAWLAQAFPDSPVAFAPGNHDAYVPVPWEDGLGKLSGYMAGRRVGESAARPASGADDFPYLRRFEAGDSGGVVVIAANSSPPTAPGLATGALGAAQIERIRSALADTKGDYRILMVHHPVTDGAAPRRKALDDRRALQDVVKAEGVELVLHGHLHLSQENAIHVPTGTTPVIGGASASHGAAAGAYRPARYNLISIERGPSEWRTTLAVRELEPASGGVRIVDELHYRHTVL